MVKPSVICIVSSGQPSANPRLVKEALALFAAGHKVKVIYCPLSIWADPFDKQLFQSYPGIEWVKVGVHPLEDRWKYRYTRFRQKLFQFLFKLAGDKFNAAVRSMALFSQELSGATKKQQADLYIGHNLGALPAVVKAARHHGAIAAFDFEDFHRGEDLENSPNWKRAKQVEDSYVPSLTFATAASPLIAREYQSLYPAISITTINNCFPLSYAVNEPGALPLAPLKLFWFSQTIGAKRGIETVIEAMGMIGDSKIELSLLGNCPVETKDYFLGIMKKNGVDSAQVKFLPVVEEKEIARIASMHHIGLACEVPHILNRELCLTNKVFMYLLAGNAIVFSKTRAQAAFLEETPGIGLAYQPDDASQLSKLLGTYLDDPALLQQHRIAALKLGIQSLNWDIEKQSLLRKVGEMLH